MDPRDSDDLDQYRSRYGGLVILLAAIILAVIAAAFLYDSLR